MYLTIDLLDLVYFGILRPSIGRQYRLFFETGLEKTGKQSCICSLGLF